MSKAIYVPQKIYDLNPLPQEGSPEYKPFSQLSIAVDNPDWPIPKAVLASDLLGTSSHIEKGRIIPDTRNVTRVFGSPFSQIPVEAAFSVYRYSTLNGGGIKKTQVLFKYTDTNWLTTAQFSIVIDSREDLSGIIIEYCFI